MSSVQSALRFFSKYGGAHGDVENIGANPRFRNINSDRMRTVFDHDGARQSFLDTLRDDMETMMKDMEPRARAGGASNDAESFLRVVNKHKLNGGSLEDMKGSLKEFSDSNKCNCDSKKRLYNGSFRHSCKCNK